MKFLIFLKRKDFSDIEVKGIAQKTMSKIMEGVPKFKKFLEELNNTSKSDKTGSLATGKSKCVIRRRSIIIFCSIIWKNICPYRIS